MSQQAVVMEQIAMYMVALPCPPLPIKVKIENYNGFSDEDKVDEDKLVVCSSHDLLAGLIICAMHRNNHALNQTRKAKQIEITKQFIQNLIEKYKNETTVDADLFYQTCCTFTADYLQSFDDPGNPTGGVQFVPMDDVVIGDKVHKACCSWHVAQEILQRKNAEAQMLKKRNNGEPEEEDIENKSEPRKAEYFAGLSYRNLMVEQCNRLLMDEKVCSEFLSDCHQGRA